MKKCVFAGSFDPVTKGHEEIMRKASEMFDEVVVALCVNPEKKYYFTTEERREFLEKTANKFVNVKVAVFDGFLTDFMKRANIVYTVRGLRNAADYEYEAEMDFYNVKAYPDAVSVFLPCSHEFARLSSSAVRAHVAFGKDVSEYVPAEIADIVAEAIEKRSR